MGTSILITYKLAINLFQTRILEFSWSSIQLEKLCKIKKIVPTTSKLRFLISRPKSFPLGVGSICRGGSVEIPGGGSEKKSVLRS